MLLVVDATPGTFETHMEDNALEEGVNAQTKEHLMLLFALGVKQARSGVVGSSSSCTAGVLEQEPEVYKAVNGSCAWGTCGGMVCSDNRFASLVLDAIALSSRMSS